MSTAEIVASCQNTSRTLCFEGLPQVEAGDPWIAVVMRIVIGLIAVISVLFVVIGGVRYILSQGDPGAVSKAKATIIYALIGLVIAIMAQALLVFVINGVLE